MKIKRRICSICYNILKLFNVSWYWDYIKGGKNKRKYITYKTEKKIFFMMTPTYGNLGDQAIEIATTLFLTNMFCDYTIIKIHLEDVYKEMKAIKYIIDEKDFIIFQGGGNFGNLYPECEQARRFIIKKCLKSNIISFPSSITYTNEKKGKNELKKSQKCYRKHNKYMIIARDYYSYDYAQRYFINNNIVLCPDIVMYLERENKDIRREDIMVCLRQDKEGCLGTERDKLIERLSEEYGNELNIIDTQLYRNISDLIKMAEFESIIKQFQRAQIVITDRLHGLIFSIICNTPCLVLKSYDTKILGTYELINNSGLVELLDIREIKDISQKIERMIKKCNNRKSTDILKPKYIELAYVIKDFINE